MKTCVKCGAEFPVRVVIGGKSRNLNNRRYCLECSPFGRHNTRTIHVSKSPGSCVRCGGPLKTGTKYCSSECCGKDVADKKFAHLDSRTSFEGENPGAIRKYLIASGDSKCAICGIHDWQDKPLPLIMDHIDGNSTNWDRSNLRLICSNCDSQLPTYKCRNRGNGRHSRRRRYSEGKSY